MLIALALVIGLVLMAFALDDPQTVVSGDDNAAADDNADDSSDDSSDSGDSAVDAVDPTGTDDQTDATIPEDTTTETIPEEPLDTGTARDPAEVNVLIANGTGGKGVAGAVADKLKAKNYIAAVSNAPSTAEAVIYYRVGYDADARAVAEVLGAPPDIITPAPGDGTLPVAQEAKDDGRLTAANVVVIIGADNNVPTS